MRKSDGQSSVAGSMTLLRVHFEINSVDTCSTLGRDSSLTARSISDATIEHTDSRECGSIQFSTKLRPFECAKIPSRRHGTLLHDVENQRTRYSSYSSWEGSRISKIRSSGDQPASAIAFKTFRLHTPQADRGERLGGAYTCKSDASRDCPRSVAELLSVSRMGGLSGDGPGGVEGDLFGSS